MNESRINFTVGRDSVSNATDGNSEIRVGDAQCAQPRSANHGLPTDCASVYRPPSKSSLRAPNGIITDRDWREAEAKAQICQQFKDLRAADDSLSLNQAAALIGKHSSWFSGPESPYVRWTRGGVAALLPETRHNGANITFEVPDWFIPAAQFFYLLTNRTRTGGSVPEAIRRTISLPNVPPGWGNGIKNRLLKKINNAIETPLKELPVCSAELREKILARERDGQELVTERIAKLVTAREATIRQHRHATNAALDYLCSPGSLFFIHDSQTGERRPPYTGEGIESDDATINFPVCVPWKLGGDKCSDKYGVKVGRFQWLVNIDLARRFVTSWSYVMRPKSSYRGEDILTGLRAHCIQHGKPKRVHYERGAWKSNLVKNALSGLGIELHTVWSPHQKPFIEGLFNVLWTKLSVHFPGCDVGRFMGETEGANDLLTACKNGQRDPRRHFPMLAAAIAAFDASVKEKNETPVQSAIGSWIPSESWAERPTATPLDRESEWLFSPWQKEWTVKGMLLGGRIPLFEDLSVPFDFTADFLPQYHGAKVRVHFDPTDPRCFGMMVLAEDFRGEKKGKVLGLGKQINEIAGYARLVLGWGDDPTNAGRLARQQAATALRREVRAVIPNGGNAFASSEQRDGISLVEKVERDAGSQKPEVRSQTPEPSTLDPRPSREAKLAELAAFERENEKLFQ